jgi:NAD(P)-dependent dehydrogenase (short-subunit alcohol dehydrogenase family)
MLLRDKVVVVSGVGPGMGVEIARAAVREGAHVVLAARTMISTIGARRARANQIDYAASKGALHAATRSLALELGPDRIRANTIAVGWMLGPPVEQGLLRLAAERGVDPDVVHDEVRRRMPLGEIPDDADCANAVVFMISDHARGITGATLDVNGGEFMP